MNEVGQELVSSQQTLDFLSASHASSMAKDLGISEAELRTLTASDLADKAVQKYWENNEQDIKEEGENRNETVSAFKMLTPDEALAAAKKKLHQRKTVRKVLSLLTQQLGNDFSTMETNSYTIQRYLKKMGNFSETEASQAANDIHKALQNIDGLMKKGQKDYAYIAAYLSRVENTLPEEHSFLEHMDELQAAQDQLNKTKSTDFQSLLAAGRELAKTLLDRGN